MKLCMYEWIGGLENIPAWFKHQEQADISWEQVQELYDAGLSVMICPPRPAKLNKKKTKVLVEAGAVGLLAIDNKSFQGR